MGGVAFQMEGFILSGMGEGRKKIVRADAPMPPTTMENPAPQPPAPYCYLENPEACQ